MSLWLRLLRPLYNQFSRAFFFQKPQHFHYTNGCRILQQVILGHSVNNISAWMSYDKKILRMHNFPSSEMWKKPHEFAIALFLFAWSLLPSWSHCLQLTAFPLRSLGFELYTESITYLTETTRVLNTLCFRCHATDRARLLWNRTSVSKQQLCKEI